MGIKRYSYKQATRLLKNDFYRKRVYLCDDYFSKEFFKNKNHYLSKESLYFFDFEKFIYNILKNEKLDFLKITVSKSKHTSYFSNYEREIQLTKSVFRNKDVVIFIHELAHAVHTYFFDDKSGDHNGTFFKIYSMLLKRYLNFSDSYILSIAEKCNVEYFMDLIVEEKHNPTKEYILNKYNIDILKLAKRKSYFGNNREYSILECSNNKYKISSLMKGGRYLKIAVRHLFPFEIEHKNILKNVFSDINNIENVIIMSPILNMDDNRLFSRSKYECEYRGFKITESSNSFSYPIEDYSYDVSFFDYSKKEIDKILKDKYKEVKNEYIKKGYTIIQSKSLDDFRNHKKYYVQAIQEKRNI